MAPILPAIAAFHSVLFASFIAFFALYLGVVNNQNFSRFVRFNAMQVGVSACPNRRGAGGGERGREGSAGACVGPHT